MTPLTLPGFEIVCNRRPDGKEGYRVREPGQRMLWEAS